MRCPHHSWHHHRAETVHFLFLPFLLNALTYALSQSFLTDGEGLEIYCGFSVARVCRGRLQAPHFSSSDSLYFQRCAIVLWAGSAHRIYCKLILKGKEKSSKTLSSVTHWNAAMLCDPRGIHTFARMNKVALPCYVGVIVKPFLGFQFHFISPVVVHKFHSWINRLWWWLLGTLGVNSVLSLFPNWCLLSWCLSMCVL